jgi:hypothetical protein
MSGADKRRGNAMAQCRNGHEEHLCQLVATNEPLDSIKEIVKDATHICTNCKRVSNDPERLCNPVALD